MEAHRKCQLLTIFGTNDSFYFDLYYISTIDGNIRKETGMLSHDGATTVMLRVYPLQYATNLQLMLSGDGFMVVYSCSACGLYGTQDSGLHPYIFTRLPGPNCTFTEPIWQQLADMQVPKGDFVLTDQSGCQALYDYVANPNPR